MDARYRGVARPARNNSNNNNSNTNNSNPEQDEQYRVLMRLWSLRSRMAFLIDNLQYYLQVQPPLLPTVQPLVLPTCTTSKPGLSPQTRVKICA